MSSKPCVPANLTAVALPPIWGWQGWFVLMVLTVAFVVIINDWVRVEFIMLISMNLIVAAQIITVDEGFVGFSNSGVLTVTILFVVAEGLSATGAIDYYLNKLMGNPKTLGLALVRMTLPTAILSAFINNTPQVALMIPILQVWARKVNIAPSMLMMPMSFSTILGGTISQLGTSTNLVVGGKALTQYCKQIGLFEIGIVGVPVTFTGLTYILIFAPYLLPGMAEYNRRKNQGMFTGGASSYSSSSRRGNFCVRTWRKFKKWLKRKVSKPAGDQKIEDFDEDYHYEDDGSIQAKDSDLVFHGLIQPSSRIVDKSVSEAGLRGVNFYLLSVDRNGKTIGAVGPDFVLRQNDILSFAGPSNEDFLAFASSRGISPLAMDTEDQSIVDADTPDIQTVHVIVRASSELVGKTPKEVDFRETYHAAILSIYRAGERLSFSGGSAGRLGQTVLKIGDLLVLVPNPKFNWENERIKQDLLLKSKSSGFLDPIEELRVDREFIIPMVVSKRAQLFIIPSIAGKTLKRSGVLDVPGVVLIAIQKKSTGEFIHDIHEQLVPEVGDIFWFVGDRDSVTGLRRVPGLADMPEKHINRLGIPGHYRRLAEVVVSHRADFVNHTVRESRFRSRFGAAVVSILRMDFLNLNQIGDYTIKGGDVLIVDCGPDFVKYFKDDPNFALVSEIPNSSPPRWSKFYVAAVACIAMVTLEVIFSVNMLVLGVFAAFIMLTFGVLTGDRAQASVEWGVIITVASAFGLSTALEKTKVAGIVGNAFVSLAVSTGTGTAGLCATILASTMLFSSLIANNAAALLMFPIAAQAAATANIDPMPILFALMLGASDYATPFGYQTNQMVLRPGMYVPLDYLKFGGPLMILLLITQTIFLATLDYWYVCWIVTGLIYVVAIIWDVLFRSKGQALPKPQNFPSFQDIRGWGKGLSFRRFNKAHLVADPEEGALGIQVKN